LQFSSAANASTKDIRKGKVCQLGSVGTQLETRRFALRALHATLRVPSKFEDRFQMIWNKLLKLDELGVIPIFQRFSNISRR